MIEPIESQKNRRSKIYFSVAGEVGLSELNLLAGQLNPAEDQAALITVAGTSLSEAAEQKLAALRSIGFDIQFSQKSRSSDRLPKDYLHTGRRRHWSI